MVKEEPEKPGERDQAARLTAARLTAVRLTVAVLSQRRSIDKALFAGPRRCRPLRGPAVSLPVQSFSILETEAGFRGRRIDTTGHATYFTMFCESEAWMSWEKKAMVRGLTAHQPQKKGGPPLRWTA